MNTTELVCSIKAKKRNTAESKLRVKLMHTINMRAGSFAYDQVPHENPTGIFATSSKHHHYYNIIIYYYYYYCCF
jgi:hypothetical protein